MKPIVLNYRGAGVAVFSRDRGGNLHVLLGKRSHHPFKGYWTYPGGGVERRRDKSRCFGIFCWNHYGESDFNAAFRELLEEVVFWTTIDALPTSVSISHPCCLRLPFWSWSTYAWLVTNPTLRLPEVNPSSPEFDELHWFPVENLPDLLHPGVLSAVRWHGKSLSI